MKIYSEGIETFSPWAGAVDTYETICNEGKLEDLEFLLEELYPDGLTETELNDILWFDDEWVYEMLGIKTEDEDEE